MNENFYDNTFNGQNWRRVKADAGRKLDEGADEHKLIAKVLSGLGDKYTRLVDKKTFENLFKYDAIGVGLLFQSDAGEPLRVSGPPTTGSSSEKAGMKKGDYILSINGRSAKDIECHVRSRHDEQRPIALSHLGVFSGFSRGVPLR